MQVHCPETSVPSQRGTILLYGTHVFCHLKEVKRRIIVLLPFNKLEKACAFLCVCGAVPLPKQTLRASCSSSKGDETMMVPSLQGGGPFIQPIINRDAILYAASH